MLLVTERFVLRTAGRRAWLCGILLLGAAGLAVADDVTVPAGVEDVTLEKSGGDVLLAWSAVTEDATGQPEVVDRYRVYRGTMPAFPSGYSWLGESLTTDATDENAAAAPESYFYLVTAVDAAGNEGGARPSKITSPPALSGFWTASTIELDWTAAAPGGEVTGYNVYYGRSSRSYEFVDAVGLSTSHSLTGLEPNRNWFVAVTATDSDGNESAFSNEHVDALAGTVEVRAHDAVRICAFDGCPAGGDIVQRRGGQEAMVPITFPEGDWVNITATFTVESNLRVAPIAPDKCGDQNPGWNPCGDPWDRTASLFLVLGDCIGTGGSCYGDHDNLELIRAITPFGTDAEPPDGTGVVGPASWTLDITPFASVLAGTKYVGVSIGTWVNPGWLTTVDFHFSEDPAEASPKPPAAGVATAWFRDGGNSSTPTLVDLPASASSVKARIFTTGHGGVTSGDCECAAQGRPCDEFCTKTITVDVGVPPAPRLTRWARRPERTDCSPLGEGVCGSGSCQDWNACGCPSCTFDRSGWCPGRIACHQNEPCDQDFDATSWFTPGETHEVLMNVRLMTAGASWANSLAIYWYD